jgi:hypothetical protein
MNDHQLSVNSTPKEVNDYIELWVQAGGNLNQLKVVNNLVIEILRLIVNKYEENK